MAMFSAGRARDGRETGYKTVVLFAENPSHHAIQLGLDSPTAKIDAPVLYDMYGNSSAAAVVPGNIVTVSAGVDPVFLSWTSPGRADQVRVVPPLLSVADSQPLLVNAETAVKILVHNAQSVAVRADVSLAATTRVSNQSSRQP